jgi:hypothetical protein
MSSSATERHLVLVCGLALTVEAAGCRSAPPPVDARIVTGWMRALYALVRAERLSPASEVARSRLYAGLHYPMSLGQGLAQGGCVAQKVMERVKTRVER